MKALEVIQNGFPDGISTRLKKPEAGVNGGFYVTLPHMRGSNILFDVYVMHEAGVDYGNFLFLSGLGLKRFLSTLFQLKKSNFKCQVFTS